MSALCKERRSSFHQTVSRFLDRRCHTDAILCSRRHRLLAQHVISLFSKREHHFSVHAILNCNHDSVCESLAHCLYRFGRGRVEILPCREDEAGIDPMRVRNLFPRLRSGFDNSNDLALGWCK